MSCASSSDDGFTVLEVVVAITVFVIVATASATAILTNVTSSRLTQQRVTAASMAQSFLAGFQSSKILPASTPTTAPGGYGVSITMSPVATAACAVGGTRTVTVLIFAPNAPTNTVPVARTDGVIAC
jgi:prepilin-type N-terminal cleavage/methylation domain-containing protein